MNAWGNSDRSALASVDLPELEGPITATIETLDAAVDDDMVEFR